MILSLIAAIGTNNELGKENKLLWDLPLDMQHFRKTTSGHAVIMGRKTYESIGQPLPNRRNIVVTRDTSYRAPGIEIVHSLDDALALFEGVPDGWNNEVFVIGGGELYTQAMPMADRLYITRVYGISDADTYFPEIGPEWKEVSRDEHLPDDSHAVAFAICVYERK